MKSTLNFCLLSCLCILKKHLNLFLIVKYIARKEKKDAACLFSVKKMFNINESEYLVQTPA